jgi:glutathionylspermidine synthase
MKRVKFVERNNWRTIADQLGFVFHTNDGHTYWDESAAYEFSLKEIENIEASTQILHLLCLETVDKIYNNRELLKKIGIEEHYFDLIKYSWENEKDFSLYGRFDLAFNGKDLKMLEYNADTPTGLFESAVFQWYWLEDLQRATNNYNLDQFNSIHDMMVDYFAKLNLKDTLYFAATRESLEDLGTVEYLKEVAKEAKLKSNLIFLEDIGLDHSNNTFVDLEGNQIFNMFKLMPWEEIANCSFNKAVKENILNQKMLFIEPAWKAILSNKAIMAVMWDLFPNHPLLLETYFADQNHDLKDFVVKPFFSREGSNVEIFENGKIVETTKTDFTTLNKFKIVQQKAELYKQDNKNMIIGSWVVDKMSCGMLVRESSNLITGESSTVVPHYIKD